MMQSVVMTMTMVIVDPYPKFAMPIIKVRYMKM